jgi:alpha-2-macroglobulin
MLLLLVCGAVPAAHAQSVAAFSPKGEVKGVRQVTARFSTPMVAFGDPRAAQPFDIACAPTGKGRWADPRNWVYDFDADLPAGVRCAFTLRPGTTDLDGKPVMAPSPFRFDTGGPAILQQAPLEGARIDEHQIFILGLDAPADPATVTANAWCSVAGISERISVRIVGGDERRKVLDARRGFLDEYLRVLVLDPASGRTRALGFTLPPGNDARSRFLKLRDSPDSPLVVLACARTLPAGADMKLVWGAGIRTRSGVASRSEQAIAFSVRPAFRASLHCERANKGAQCLPIRPIVLTFSAPLARTAASQVRLLDANGNAHAQRIEGNAGDAWVDTLTFQPPFPEMATFRVELPAGLEDDAGRKLVNARQFPLKVRTDQSPPLAKFAANFGILEAHAGDAAPMLPVTVRNVEPSLAGRLASVPAGANVPGRVLKVAPGDEHRIVEWLSRLDAGDRIDARFDERTERWIVSPTGVAQSLFGKADATTPLRVPVAQGGKAFEVVGIPLAGMGFYVVELASPRLGASIFGSPRTYYARSAALVTNLAVHLKRGRESSLVWVTHLDDATPAAAASVDVQDCSGKSLWRGATDASGIARIDAELPDVDALPKCNADGRRAVFAVARAGDDMAFAFSDWDAGIAPWRFNLPTGNYAGPYVAHAVFDRTLLRAGDTLSMKLFVRRQVEQGFAAVAADTLGTTLSVRHEVSDRAFDVPVSWSGGRFGTASFAIPKDAPLGSYRVVMFDSLPTARGGRSERHERTVGRFRVEEFRVPLMRARVQVVGGPFVNVASVPLDIAISYLSGGGAGGLPVMLRTQTRAREVMFPGFDDYSFAASDVRVGRTDHEAESEDDGEDDDGSVDAHADDGAVTSTPLTLDASGGARTTAANLAASDKPRELVAEVEYRDPNGETSTAATNVALWNAGIVLGIKPDGWITQKDRVRVAVATLDTTGKPRAGVHVVVDAFRREFFSHRRRLIGGFYAFSNGSDTTRLGDFCEGTSNAAGIVTCEAPVSQAGNVILRARAADAAGNPAFTQREVLVAGDDDQWFDANDSDRIDVLPEHRSYAPGDTARFEVRTPFREATVLVSVEREGVLDAFVTRLDRSNPVISVPIKSNYSPNVFVSALLVRGRVAGVQPTAMVDLGKPSFRMGIGAIKVGWSAHALDVAVHTDRETYRTRDRAHVEVVVKRQDGGALPPGGDVAIAAVDEGLLELLPNDSWKLLDAMMAERGIEVDTATASMQVVGRRHFGRKAQASGGGGGRQSARELFDTLLAWRASVPLDASGHASLDIPLSDSLTGFRIVAIADAGDAFFGAGATSIRTTQPLMLLSGLPQGVRSGDRVHAGFTVRNASDAAQKIDITATLGGAAALPPLAPQHVDLAAGAARAIGWDIDVPSGVDALAWRVEATAASEGRPAEHDTLQVNLPVTPAVAERVYQSTILRLEAPQSITVERPADALPGRGGLDVEARNRLAGALPGVARWLAAYPFDCLEQQASAAVGLHDRARWDALMARLPAYLDDDGLARFWPFLLQGDDTLTAYLYSVADQSGFALPADAREKMEAGMIAFVEGKVTRGSALPTADLTLRKLAALEALSRRKGEFPARWLDSFVVEPNLWPTSAVIDWYLILAREAQLPQRDARLDEARGILRARLDFQGTTMRFSTERNDQLWWLMVDGDVNANRLVLAVVDDPAWREDMPRLVRGALGRMARGHWSTTPANAWGVLALDRFAERFESTPVTGAVAATLAGAVATAHFAGSADVETHTLHVAWPATRDALGLAHTGDGIPWVTLTGTAAIPLDAPLASGYTLARSITPVSQKTPGRYSVGDLARVHVDIDAQSDMTWVALVDPIPSGATILGRGFGNESTIATRGERGDTSIDPSHEERGAREYRAFYRLLPKGHASVEYTLRLNNAGAFVLPGTRAEAMYAPEMFGELPGSRWEVAP